MTGPENISIAFHNGPVNVPYPSIQKTEKQSRHQEDGAGDLRISR